MLSEKARKFIDGRRGEFAAIKAALEGNVNPVVWVHCASYGEFEEVRPVVEEFRKIRPDRKIFLTFFSPSGYEHFKNDPLADYVFYLPIETPLNVKRFLDLVRPEKMILSISDFWPGFLHGLRRRGIPAYLSSACFTPGMTYFKPQGYIYRDLFRRCFRKIIVRDEGSLQLMEGIGVKNAMIVGDPRMDRVLEIAAEPWSDPIVDKWASGRKVFVAGSTLRDEDEIVTCDLANAHPDDKFLIIPHEIGAEEVNGILSGIKGSCAVYSRFKDGDESAQVLIVDKVGMLSRLYRYGFAAYVGSGFDCSPHSIIEPAAYGIPVSYGPKFGSYRHCQGLIDAGGGISISNSEELSKWYDSLVSDPAVLEAAGSAARKYCVDGSGVASKIAAEIAE